MDSAKFNDWLQIVGLAAVVGSLIFVGLQVKQADDIAYSEKADSASATAIELRALIADHADVWQKACLGSELTAAEKVIAGSIYRSYVHANYNSWVSKEATGVGGSSGKHLTDMYAANLYRYPGFRDMATSFGEWSEFGVRWDEINLGESYGLAVRERVAELQQLEPNPIADVMWCGVM